MFTLATTVPVANSTWEGTPIPIAFGSPATAATSRTVASMPSSRASVESRAVGCSTVCRASPSSRTPTATFVPPTSTPRMATPAFWYNGGNGSSPRVQEHPHGPDRGRDLADHLRALVRRGAGLHLMAEELPPASGDPVPPPGEQVHLPGATYLPAWTAFGITIALVG